MESELQTICLSHLFFHQTSTTTKRQTMASLSTHTKDIVPNYDTPTPLPALHPTKSSTCTAATNFTLTGIGGSTMHIAGIGIRYLSFLPCRDLRSVRVASRVASSQTDALAPHWHSWMAHQEWRCFTMAAASAARAAARQRIAAAITTLKAQPEHTGKVFVHDIAQRVGGSCYAEVPFSSSRSFREDSPGSFEDAADHVEYVARLPSSHFVAPSELARRCGIEANDFFELVPVVSPEGLTVAHTSVRTRRCCGHCRRGLNRALCAKPIAWASGTTCICLSATRLSGAHKDFDSTNIFVFLDTAGNATGVPGAIFELERLDAEGEDMTFVGTDLLPRDPLEGLVLPAQLREEIILHAALSDVDTYAGLGYELSPCCGRPSALSLAEYLERLAAIACDDGEHKRDDRNAHGVLSSRSRAMMKHHSMSETRMELIRLIGCDPTLSVPRVRTEEEIEIDRQRYEDLLARVEEEHHTLIAMELLTAVEDDERVAQLAQLEADAGKCMDCGGRSTSVHDDCMWYGIVPRCAECATCYVDQERARCMDCGGCSTSIREEYVCTLRGGGVTTMPRCPECAACYSLHEE